MSTAINPSDLHTSVTIFLKPFLVLSPLRALNIFASFGHTWRTKFLIKHQGANYSKIVSSRYFVRALKLECVHVMSCHVVGYAQYHSRWNISIHLYTQLLSINKVRKQEFFLYECKDLTIRASYEAHHLHKLMWQGGSLWPQTLHLPSSQNRRFHFSTLMMYLWIVVSTSQLLFLAPHTCTLE